MPPPLRHSPGADQYWQVRTYPSGLATDVLFYEVRDVVMPGNKMEEGHAYGEPHPNTAMWPDHELVFVSAAKEAGKQLWYYAAKRSNQDLYNFQINRGAELLRMYVIPRTTYYSRPEGVVSPEPDEFLYPPAGAASPDARFPMYCFVDDTLVRAEKELDSLYVIIQRRYVEPVTVEYAFNTTLMKQVSITKEIIPPVDAAPEVSVAGTVVEIQKGNFFHDVRVTQQIVLGEGVSYPYLLDTLPGVYNKPFPPRLDSVDLNWAWANAVNNKSMPSYDEQYYFAFKLTEPRPGPYSTTVAQYVTNDPATLAAAHPITPVPSPIAESIGVATAWASAGDFGNATRATCREWNLPPSLHEEVTVNVGGVSSPLYTASSHTESIAATPGATAFFALTSMVVDHPVEPAPLGLYIVSIVTADISSLYDDPMGVYVPLDVPDNLVVATANDTQIDLTWDAVVGATSYQILRSLTAGSFTLVDTSVTASFSDTGLAPATLYYYRVRALGTAVASPYSAIGSDTTDP